MAKTVSKAYKGFCPDCNAPIIVERRIDVGSHLHCPKCGIELEVLSLSPFELDYAYSGEWGEEEEEGEDD